MDAIMRDFPYSFETERLTIRGPLPGDGRRIREAVLESHDELKKWMPWAVEVESEEAYEVRVRKGQLRFLAREDLHLILLLKDSDTMVGSSGLHRMNWDVPRFEIGYWVRTRYAGQGYITEAVAGITDFAFNVLGAKRVEIRCDALNHRSAAVPKRLGFAHEGTLHNHERHHLTKKLRDTLIFAKVSGDE